MAEKFIEWFFYDCIPGISETMDKTVAFIGNAIFKIFRVIVFIFVATITAPIWILPFIYWYFFIRKDGKEKTETMKEYYNENADFKAYVDKYARDYKLSVEEALESALVRQAYEYYKEEQATEEKEGV